MDTKKISINIYTAFTAFALFWVFLGWLGFLAALAGFFYKWIFIGYFILGAIGIIYRIRTSLSYNHIWLYDSIKKFISRKKSDKPFSEFYCVAIVILIISLFFSLFTVPTVFSGRDQGSISEAGIRLAQNHQLKFSTPASQEFFKIYGPGKALNFPGFHYTQNGQLITQFPLSYIAWLGIFYSIFGLAGLIIANAVLFYLFLFSSYLLFRIFASLKYSLIFLLLTSTFFPFSWFLKFTLSENTALALIWLGILQLVLFFKEKNNLNFFSLWAIFGLMIFTRIEGVLLFIMLAIIMLSNKSARNFLAREKMKRIFCPALIFIVIFMLNFIVDFSFFKEIGKAFLKNTTSAVEVSPLASSTQVFMVYGIMPYLILGAIGIFYFLKKRKLLELYPFFLTAPVFLYLIDPQISSEHTWMLRRYVFAVFPALIFYTVLWLAYHSRENKNFWPRILIMISLLLSFPAFFKYFPFSENKDLLEQTKDLSQNFSNEDLILVDRVASGEGWSMLSGPLNFLYNKNAVYFFNPDDLNKIDLNKFDKIYLITPEEKINFYKNSPLENRLEFYKDYRIETRRMETFNKNAKNISLPEKKSVKVEGKIFEIGK